MNISGVGISSLLAMDGFIIVNKNTAPVVYSYPNAIRVFVWNPSSGNPRIPIRNGDIFYASSTQFVYAVNIKSNQTMQSYVNDNAAWTHPLALASNQLFGYNTGLIAIQTWNSSTGRTAGYITGISSTTAVYMGVSSQQSNIYLVYITTDSTMLVFDASTISTFLDQQQINKYGFLNSIRPPSMRIHLYLPSLRPTWCATAR
jgi:hypothetical protein